MPSTRSFRTAPASTLASWSASPTRTRRAEGRTASSRRAIIVRESIEVSSTTTTSYGSRLPRSWRKRVLLGVQPSRRCRVEAFSDSMTATAAWACSPSAGKPRCEVDSLTACTMRAAALPVGAASAMRSGRSPSSLAACTCMRTPRRRATVRGLAGAGAAGDDAGAVADGGRRGGALVGVLVVGEVGGEGLGEDLFVDGGCLGAGLQVGDDLLLLGPVAVEVEEVVVEVEDVVVGQRAGGDGLLPGRLRLWEGQVGGDVRRPWSGRGRRSRTARRGR